MKTSTIITTISLIAIILLTACSGITTQAVHNEPIKIGAVLMLTGVGSNWGDNSQKGAELAVKEINSNDGINGKLIEIVYEDNQGDNPAVAVTALHKLNAQDIKIVLGPNWSPSGNAVAPMACDEGILMISPSLGVADFNEKCDYLFNLWPHDDALSTKLGGYLFEKGHRKIAILGSQQVWEETQAKAVKKGFETAGGKVVSLQLPQSGQQDFRTEALKIKAANPDAVVLTAYSFEHLAAKQLKEIGVTAPFYSILIDDDRIKGAEGTLENTIVITSFTPNKEFVDKFVATHHEQPDIGSDTSYDSVMLIANAMRETNSYDPTILKDYLNALKSYSGASGNLEFDGKGGVTKQARFMMVKNSTLTPLEKD